MAFLGVDVDLDDVFLAVGVVATVGTAGAGAWAEVEDDIFSDEFLLKRPLLRAISTVPVPSSAKRTCWTSSATSSERRASVS